jgi:hypothetical protein
MPGSVASGTLCRMNVTRLFYYTQDVLQEWREEKQYSGLVGKREGKKPF